jgi:hypothetical protein
LLDLAIGWDGKTVLVIAHSANKWALDHLLEGLALEDFAAPPFNWQAGWRYVLSVDKAGECSPGSVT